MITRTTVMIPKDTRNRMCRSNAQHCVAFEYVPAPRMTRFHPRLLTDIFASISQFFLPPSSSLTSPSSLSRHYVPWTTIDVMKHLSAPPLTVDMNSDTGQLASRSLPHRENDEIVLVPPRPASTLGRPRRTPLTNSANALTLAVWSGTHDLHSR